MARWFYCVELFKNGKFERKVSGVYPEVEDATLTEIAGLDDPKAAYDSIVWQHGINDPDVEVIVTALNKV